MRKSFFPINYDDPMNGIIKYMRGKKMMNYLSANESSCVKNDPFKPAYSLLEQSESNNFQLYANKKGEYFEIHFLNGSFVYLTGYGIMASTVNHAVPRNWEVSCMSTNPPTTLDNVAKNYDLCPYATSSITCKTNEKKAFECDTKFVKCTSVRFAATGFTAYAVNHYNIALSGIELFGYFISSGFRTFNCNYGVRICYVLIYCLVFLC